MTKVQIRGYMFHKSLLMVLVLMAGQAYGGKLIFGARVDALRQQFNDDAAASALGNNNFRYTFKTARLDYSNNLNDKTNVQARLTLNTDQGAVNKRDSLNNFVELFFINHKLVEGLELTLGKFSSDMGGTEFQYASADVYQFSSAYSGGPAIDGFARTAFNTKTGNSLSASWTWTGTGTVRYYTGAKATYKFCDQEVAIHTANLSSDELTAGTSSQTRTLIGGVYKGNFLEKKIQPILSFHEARLPNTAGTDAKLTFLAAGLKLTIANHTFDVDYLVNNFKDRTALTNGNLESDHIDSILVGWSKSFNQWSPRLKFESSRLKVAGEKIFDVLGYSAALEWKPVPEDNFRYHLAYNGKSYKPDSGNTLTSDEFLLGVRIAADILK